MLSDSNFERLTALLTPEEKEFAKGIVVLRSKSQWDAMTPEQYKIHVEVSKVIFPEAWEKFKKSTV